MPHLDAKALTEDPKGLEFLAEVIEVPADRQVGAWVAEGASACLGQSILPKVEPRRRRRREALVPEAA